MRALIKFFIALFALTAALNAFAAADLEVNTPGINAIKQSMQARHAQLAAHYSSGAVGLTADGMIALRDAGAVPLAQRQAVNALVAAENNDRNALYAEIANANGHPEWQGEIRSTFAQRWIQRAQSGWWVQSGGAWKQK
ncbi:MAG: YdbL family protein [Gallionella sp.]|nr:YdbL family protein [Gallionella sp.]